MCAGSLMLGLLSGPPGSLQARWPLSRDVMANEVLALKRNSRWASFDGHPYRVDELQLNRKGAGEITTLEVYKNARGSLRPATTPSIIAFKGTTRERWLNTMRLLWK